MSIVSLLSHALSWYSPTLPFHAFQAREGGIIKAQFTFKYLAVAVIFFISGLSLPLINLYKRGREWKLHLAAHLTNFLLFPAVVFAIVSCIRAADPDFERFDRFALVGMVVMGCLPTTVSSNVVMTGQAGGDQSAATIEVMIGNLVGTFLSPALLQMFLSSSVWSFGQPQASGSGGTGEIYRQVIMQLGLSVFIPLIVGEAIQNIWPKPVAWFRNTFYLAKVGSMCLITVIWQVESLPSSRSTTNGATCRSTFSGAFYAGAFQALSTPTIIVVLFVNIGLYVVFSIFLFTLARLIPFPSPKSKSTTVTSADGGETVATKSTQPLFDPSTTIALMFCGPAKGIVLGGPIVNILYGGIAPVDAGMVTVPLVLYQGSQVVLGQIVVALLKAWMRRVKLKEAREGLEGIEEKKEVGEEVTVVELEADEDGERTRAGSIEGKK